jgi:dolichyl-phosphate beta-glucosyltransferase
LLDPMSPCILTRMSTSRPLLLSIVIPAFNEEMRLPHTLETLGALIARSDLRMGPHALVASEVEVIVVDDGSSDRTAQVAKELGRRFPVFKVISFAANRGKGAAVRQGLLEASAPWILFADADMSTPWTELGKLAERQSALSLDIAIASRALPESEVRVHQSFSRERMGKTFNWIIRQLTRLPFPDTQCGFKLFHREKIAKILPYLQIDRFAWDVELLLLASRRGLKIGDVAVRWDHKEASRVRPIFDSMEMLISVIKMRLRLSVTAIGTDLTARERESRS